MKAANPTTAPFDQSLSLSPSTNHALPPRFIGPFLPFANLIHAFDEADLAVTVCQACLWCVFCVVLFNLFKTILDSALTVWARLPPANQVVLEAGSLRIEFGCTMEPVPWEFIADFAASAKDAAERGFAPVSKRQWWWRRGIKNDAGEGPKSRVCYVVMRVVEDGRVVVPPG